MFSTPTAWPPEDHQMPLIEGVNSVDPKLFYSARSINSVLKTERWRMNFVWFVVVSSVMLVILEIGNLVDILLGAFFLVVLSNYVTKFLVNRNVVAKDPAVVSRNKAVLHSLYDFFESPALASSIFISAIADADIDIYTVKENEAVQLMKDYLVENKVGQRNCSNGHTSLCSHRIPAEKRDWLETPVLQTVVIKPADSPSETVTAS